MKNMIRLFFVFALSSCNPALASQNAVVLPTVSPYPGLTMLNNINSAFNTFQTNFSGATAPSSPATYQYWFDTSNNLLKIYDGAAWQPLGVLSSGWTVTSSGFKQLAISSTGSANAYAVTYSPAPTALVVGQKYSFITNFPNTGAATVNFNGLGAKPLKKQGGVALLSGDLSNVMAVDCVYDGTNCQITSQISNAAVGTVTSIATNNGITGGPITSAGTVGLATISAGNVLANITGSTAIPTPNTPSQILDSAFSSTQGAVLYRDSAAWQALAPGTNGQVLKSGGASANPTWGAGGFSSCTTVLNSSASVSTISASCSSGYTLTGGGCDSAFPLFTSGPSSLTWTCISGGSGFLSATAICCH